MGLLKWADRFHTYSNALIKDRFPLFSLYYYTRPRMFLYWRTQPIHSLVNGTLKNTSTQKSVLFFTVHKSASTFMEGFLKDLSEHIKLTHIDYNGYYAGRGGDNFSRLKDPNLLNKVFKDKGFIYGPLRFYLEVPHKENYLTILLLRDPRDVLVSQYFSIRNTHPLITKKLIERRKKSLESTIDEHVKSEAGRFVDTYQLYIDNIFGKENVLFLKYETLITDFNLVLQRISKHLNLELSEEQLKQLDRSDVFRQDKEDILSHKRKVIAGDYKEKLNAETIAWLNKKFETILKKLDYPL